MGTKAVGITSRMRLLVWGGGGHGKVVADLVRASGHDVAGFVDSDPGKLDQVVEPGGARVTMLQSELLRWGEQGRCPPSIDAVAVAIGDNRRRQWCVEQLAERVAPALVHPRAVVSEFAVLGAGTVVMAGALVNSAAVVGRGAIINTGAIVEHDCVVGEAAHVSPGAVLGGGVRIGSASWVGAGATVIQQVSVGSDVTIGAGAVIIRDVADALVVVGNPGRVIRKSNP